MEIPDEVSARDLDRSVRVQLKGLSKEGAEAVARHLVMVGRLIDSDPAQAHKHAIAAAERGGRIAVVRETVGITAYAVGDFARALRELRTYRRISGRDDEIALMVDSERGVGRPERALEIGRAVPTETLPRAVRVSLAIAMSGARLDLGQAAQARRELEIPELDADAVFDSSPALFDAYAEVLEGMGDPEATAWRDRAQRARSALYTASQAAAEETVTIFDEAVVSEGAVRTHDLAAPEGDAVSGRGAASGGAVASEGDVGTHDPAAPEGGPGPEDEPGPAGERP